MTEGVFLVVEGPDGSGKSTLAARLAARLRARGTDPVVVREPGGTPVAEAARKVFLDPRLATGAVSELFLVLAARADLVATVIRPALAAGRVVLSERFDFSTEAYQIEGRGLDRVKVRAANHLATGGLEPDLVLVLDVPPAVGEARQRKAGKTPDRLELAEAGMHDRVAAYFAALTGPGVVHLDATKAPDVLETEAWHEVERRFGKQLGPEPATTR